MTPSAPAVVLCPRCGTALDPGETAQVDCDHCGGCWQTDRMTADLQRWYIDTALFAVLARAAAT